jgi:hypothetical protein
MTPKGAHGTKRYRNPVFKWIHLTPFLMSSTVFSFMGYSAVNVGTAPYYAMLAALCQARLWLQSLRIKQKLYILWSCKTLVIVQREGHFNVMDWPYSTCEFWRILLIAAKDTEQCSGLWWKKWVMGSPLGGVVTGEHPGNMELVVTISTPPLIPSVTNKTLLLLWRHSRNAKRFEVNRAGKTHILPPDKLWFC